MNKEELRKSCQEHADSNKFVLQPDERMLDTILTGLLKNEEKHGFRYCPCRRVSGNPEQDEKIICPCVFHEQELQDDGHCKCMLFLSK